MSTLLAGPWRGDLVAFAGEYIFDLRGDVAPEGHSGLSRLFEVVIGSDCVDCEFEDITGRFPYARGKDGWAPSTLEDGSEAVNPAPYTGPFALELVRYRFMVNETKGLYYDRENTERSPNGCHFDPLPLLLGTARGVS